MSGHLLDYYLRLFKYNAMNNALAERVEIWEFPRDGAVARNTQTYDDQGNTVFSLSGEFVSGQWSTFDSSVYTYDNNGMCRSMYDYINYVNGQWARCIHDTMTYYPDKTLRSHVTEWVEGSQLETSHRESYAYDSF